jgi:hypothetical protein
MTPPTIAPVFEPPSECEDVDEDDGAVVRVPVGPIPEPPKGLSAVPGPISGESEDADVRRQKPKKTKKQILTTNSKRFVGIPIVLGLECAVSFHREDNLGTNCDVKECPLREASSRRNRVRESGSKLPC